MDSPKPLALLLAQERMDREIRDAQHARLVRVARLAGDRRTSLLRRTIGHSIIRLGQRLAADPPMTPARSR